MATVTFEYSALYYLNWWLVRDREYCSGFEGTNTQSQLEVLRKAAVAYRVARNLPLAYDLDAGFPRLQPVLDAINAATRSSIEGSNLVPGILRVRDAISRVYGGDDLLSVTTKFLWLRFKRPIIIYDGNARRALRAVDSDLQDFYSKWRAEYQCVQDQLRAACDLLPRLEKFCIDTDIGTAAYIKCVADTDWFRERVFDIYLWHTGAR